MATEPGLQLVAWIESTGVMLMSVHHLNTAESFSIHAGRRQDTKRRVFPASRVAWWVAGPGKAGYRHVCLLPGYEMKRCYQRLHLYVVSIPRLRKSERQ